MSPQKKGAMSEGMVPAPKDGAAELADSANRVREMFSQLLDRTAGWIA